MGVGILIQQEQFKESKQIINWENYKEINNEEIKEYYNEECGTKPLNVTYTGGMSFENKLLIAELKAENDMLKEDLCFLEIERWC